MLSFHYDPLRARVADAWHTVRALERAAGRLEAQHDTLPAPPEPGWAPVRYLLHTWCTPRRRCRAAPWSTSRPPS